MNVLKKFVEVNRCIKVICTDSHKITSFETYKFLVVQKPQKADCVATGRLSSSLCEVECSNDVYTELKYFTDEKLFY
jgi:hypothetical protein